MSGLAGVFRPDRASLEPGMLDRLMSALAHRGADNSGHWRGQGIEMGFLAWHSTPESQLECQPYQDRESGLVIHFDGRLDHRDDLIRRLGWADRPVRSLTDVALVLEAFKVWDRAAFAKLEGEFALAIWDPTRATLFCARDYLGLRPFFYGWSRGLFCWGSELGQVARIGSLKVNIGMMGEYLANHVTSLEETLFTEVMRLPQAHYLTINEQGLIKHRYWDIDPSVQIRYRDPRAYVDHFETLFEDAVRQHLRIIGRLGCDLSGGLDSSSVVAMATKVGRELGLDHRPEAFSHVFPGMACDESPYIDAMVQAYHLKSTRQDGREPLRESVVSEVARTLDLPDFPITPMYRPLYQRAHAKGVRVVLTGVGGDEWFFGSLMIYADLLRGMRWPTLWRRLRNDPLVSGVVLPQHPFRENALWPLLPLGFQKLYRRLRTGFRQPKNPAIRRWLLGTFCKDIHLADRIRTRHPCPPFKTIAKRDLYNGISDPWQVQGNESGDRFRASIPIEQRHPLHDRRLIEFAFAVPEAMHWRQGTPKWLLRQAMGGRLPPKIAHRLDKADFSEIFAKRLLDPEIKNRFNGLFLAEQGMVCQKTVTNMVQNLLVSYKKGDDSYIGYAWELWLILAVEIWLEQIGKNH